MPETPVPYLEEETDQINAAAAEFCTYAFSPGPLDPDSVTISGCPVCEHPTSFRRIITVVAGVLPIDLAENESFIDDEERPQDGDNEPKLLRSWCRCAVDHGGGSGKGCGRSFVIPVYWGA